MNTIMGLGAILLAGFLVIPGNLGVASPVPGPKQSPDD